MRSPGLRVWCRTRGLKPIDRRVPDRSIAMKNGIMRCGDRARSSIIRDADRIGQDFLPCGLSTYGPEACANWESELEISCLRTCFSRSASVTVKSVIKAGLMVSSLIPALVFMVGCNTDEPAPVTPSTPSGPAANKPGDKAPAPTPTPSTPKPKDAK